MASLFQTHSELQGTAKTLTPRPYWVGDFLSPIPENGAYTVVAQLEYSSVVQAQSASAILPNQVYTYTFDQLPLQRGGLLGPITLAYETWGNLNAQGNNAILITHSLTGSSHAYDPEFPD